MNLELYFLKFFFKAEDGIRDGHVTGVQTCALPICGAATASSTPRRPWSAPASSGRWATTARTSRAAPTTRCGCEIGRASSRERVMISRRVAPAKKKYEDIQNREVSASNCMMDIVIV